MTNVDSICKFYQRHFPLTLSCCLFIIVNGLIMIAVAERARGQEIKFYGDEASHPTEPKPKEEVEVWAPPDPPSHELCHQAFTRFYRLRLEGGAVTDWTLYLDKDKEFLGQFTRRVQSGQSIYKRVEWFALAGSLPRKDAK